MGFFGKVADKAFGFNATYLPPDKLAEMVKELFIDGADAKQLKEVKGAIRGWITKSADGKYELTSGSILNKLPLTGFFAPKRNVSINEKGTKNSWKLDKPTNYKNFYNQVMSYIGDK